MAEETGVVVRPGRGKARVLIKRTEKCAGCRGCQLSDGSDFMTLDVIDPFGVARGKKVKIQSAEGSAAKSGFILYIVPLISLFVGYLIGNRLVSTLAGSSAQGWGVLSAFLFMALTYLAIYLLQNRFSSKSLPQMRIVRIVGTEDDST